MKKNIITIFLLLFTTIAIAEKVLSNAKNFSGIYTVNYKRSLGSIGSNILFGNNKDIAPYTPIHINASNNTIQVVYSRYNETITTNNISVGTASTDWKWYGDELMHKSVTTAKGLMLPGSVKIYEQTKVSKDKWGNIIVRTSMEEQGKAFWILRWKDPPVAYFLVLRPITNLVELAETRKKWKNPNK